jgi:hypothetical protein
LRDFQYILKAAKRCTDNHLIALVHNTLHPQTTLHAITTGLTDVKCTAKAVAMKIAELAVANLNQYLYDRDNFTYTARMREPWTARASLPAGSSAPEPQ